MDFLAAGNLLVLCPVIAVVAGVVLVFLFGFKQPSQPKKFATTSDATKKPKKKETKKPVTSGLTEKTSSSTEPSRKERAAEVVAKKSPVKEVSQKKTPARQENVKTQSKSKPAVKSTKKDKAQAEPVQKKPDDFDDGSWFTVPTKSEKKKPKLEDVTSSPKPEAARVEQSIVEKKNAKNAKQLKDQANKSKKEAEDAAATSAATKVLQVEKIIAEAEPVVVAVEKTISTVLNEEDKQTAEIIEKIHEAIADVVVEPVVVQKQIVSKSISKKIVADREEKVDEIKPVESNIAFDELADAWTDAKPTKKNKKKVRKD